MLFAKSTLENPTKTLNVRAMVCPDRSSFSLGKKRLCRKKRQSPILKFLKDFQENFL
jgi:hypothetical protein